MQPILVTLEPNLIPRVQPTCSAGPVWVRKRGRLVKLDDSLLPSLVQLDPNARAYQTIRSLAFPQHTIHFEQSFRQCESLMREISRMDDMLDRERCLVSKVIPCLMSIVQSPHFSRLCL